MPDILHFAHVPTDSLLQVGGKGLSLARTAAAGLPVPDGFIVTTDAYKKSRSGINSDLRQQIESAYQQLGSGAVAVRSSATSEDGAETSFAGQQETILGVKGLDSLIDAIQQCWRSLYTDRAVAYRKAQGIAEDGAAMAVVVQKLIPADVAGVLFTQDPSDSTGTRMSIEASWGLGEAVVSGRVTPDRFIMDRQTGTALSRKAGAKTLRITANGEEAVPLELQHSLCLNDQQLKELTELGHQVEAVYGDPRDIEWAIADSKLYLLQARPITTTTAAEREQICREIQGELKKLVDPAGTVWVRYNLSETLPEPTPMTWDIIQVLLASNGGFGALNRDLGGDPDESLGSLGAFDLIAGRPMANLSRMPRLQFRKPPFEYPFEKYKVQPRLALDPVPELKPLRNGWLGLPGTILRMGRHANRTRKLVPHFDKTFLNEIVPSFANAARTSLSEDLSSLPPPILLNRLKEWVQKTNIDFARHSLKPTVLASFALQFFVDLLTPKLKAEGAKTASRKLAAAAKPPAGCALADGVHDFASGMMSRTEFLNTYGHRGGGEMELARPRWSEDPAAVDAIYASKSPAISAVEDPWPRIAKQARIPRSTRNDADTWLERLRTYVGLREAGKHYWLMGYAVIRRLLVELDQRFKLNGGIFYLTQSELPDLIAGKELTSRISARKKRRQIELTLEVPPVLFCDDLDAIGRPQPVPEGAASFEGIALSAGIAEGPALVLTEPTTPPDSPYILVCPSTDPAWVPLFARARGLVMETGGVLSHGAIVAREFGLPAVAGLPGIVSRIQPGQHLRVDGNSGNVSIIS